MQVQKQAVGLLETLLVSGKVWDRAEEARNALIDFPKNKLPTSLDGSDPSGKAGKKHEGVCSLSIFSLIIIPSVGSVVVLSTFTLQIYRSAVTSISKALILLLCSTDYELIPGHRVIHIHRTEPKVSHFPSCIE